MKSETVTMQGNGWTGIDSIILKIAALIAALSGIAVGVQRAWRLARSTWKTISAFARAGDQILLLQERLAVIVETLPEPILRLDKDGHLVFASSAFLRLVNMSDSEAASTGWQAAIHPDDAERFQRVWLATIKDKARFTIAIRLRNATETISVSARLFPLLNQDGTVIETKMVLRVNERHPITGSGAK